MEKNQKELKLLRESISKKQVFHIRISNEMKERGAFIGGLGCGVIVGANIHK